MEMFAFLHALGRGTRVLLRTGMEGGTQVLTQPIVRPLRSQSVWAHQPAATCSILKEAYSSSPAL